MLWAVHIGNNVLVAPVELGGFVLAGVLVAIGAWRIHADEVPRIALLTAASFIASSMHVPLGPTSVHLLLNGLVGVLLGRRAAVAIFVGLVLQAVLLSHGGFTALGVNECVLTIPALLCSALFRILQPIAWLKRPVGRAILVAVSVGLWILFAVASVSLLWLRIRGASDEDAAGQTVEILSNGVTLSAAALLAGAAAWLEARLEHAPEFPLGLLIGEVAVLLTVALASAVLIAGGAYFGSTPPLVLAVAHLPVAAVEGVVLGFTLGFLAKVKPELLGMGSSVKTPETGA